VLDGAHPGLERGHDPGLAVAVGRHHAVGHRGHLDHRPQLSQGELLVDGIVQL
jgi:hypothetical protein